MLSDERGSFPNFVLYESPELGQIALVIRREKNLYISWTISENGLYLSLTQTMAWDSEDVHKVCKLSASSMTPAYVSPHFNPSISYRVLKLQHPITANDRLEKYDLDNFYFYYMKSSYESMSSGTIGMTVNKDY